jgi:Protein kinase domain
MTHRPEVLNVKEVKELCAVIHKPLQQMFSEFLRTEPLTYGDVLAFVLSDIWDLKSAIDLRRYKYKCPSNPENLDYKLDKNYAEIYMWKGLELGLLAAHMQLFLACLFEKRSSKLSKTVKVKVVRIKRIEWPVFLRDIAVPKIYGVEPSSFVLDLLRVSDQLYGLNNSDAFKAILNKLMVNFLDADDSGLQVRLGAFLFEAATGQQAAPASAASRVLSSCIDKSIISLLPKIREVITHHELDLFSLYYVREEMLSSLRYLVFHLNLDDNGRNRIDWMDKKRILLTQLAPAFGICGLAKENMDSWPRSCPELPTLINRLENWDKEHGTKYGVDARTIFCNIASEILDMTDTWSRQSREWLSAFQPVPVMMNVSQLAAMNPTLIDFSPTVDQEHGRSVNAEAGEQQDHTFKAVVPPAPASFSPFTENATAVDGSPSANSSASKLEASGRFGTPYLVGREPETSCSLGSKPNRLTPGSIFEERFKILCSLGEGGMGAVFQAHDIVLDRQVAIKILAGAVQANTETVLRLQREARALSRLDHPNLIRVYDFKVSDAGEPYLLMEYVKGVPLEAILEAEGTIERQRCFKLFMDLCDALQHAHDHNVVHRDLKPGNVMRTTHKKVELFKLFDFGIAKFLKDEMPGNIKLTAESGWIGTACYMSPEQFDNVLVDGRADQYSLGCMLYECLTGELPLVGRSWFETRLMRDRQRISDLPRDIAGSQAGELTALIRRMMDKDPDKRYPDVISVRAELERIEKIENLEKICS